MNIKRVGTDLKNHESHKTTPSLENEENNFNK